MTRKNFKRFFFSAVCCVLAFVMIAVSSPIVFADNTEASEGGAGEDEYREQIGNLQDEQIKIQEEMKNYENKIANIKDDKKKQQALANSIDEKIDIIERSIEVIKEKVSVTQKYINGKIADINRKQREIDKTMDLFRKRVRAIYMTGGYSNETNSLLMLLTSNSVSEFLSRSEYLDRIAQHDEAMLLELREELTSLSEEKAVLEKERADLEAEKVALEEEEAALEKELQNAKNQIHDLSAMQKEYQENYAELSEMQKQIQAELLEIYKNLQTSDEDYVGGEMMWPVPGYSKISSEYGWRFNNTDFHTGMDITGSGVHGAKVVAANTGTVVFTKSCPYNGKSYGYGTYIIVDHGGGITTLYAHLSAIDVSVGDIVVMGQQIGRVGNTGWSTGAHLHFEVRINGDAVNPKGYVT